MVFVRKIKKPSGIYLAKVRSYREDGKVKQEVIQYLGREVNKKPVRRVSTNNLQLLTIKESLDVQVIHHLAKELGLTKLENKYWLVLAYSHMLENRSIVKLAKWLEYTEIPQVLEIEEIATQKLYDSLDSLAELKFSTIENNIYEHCSHFEKGKKAAIIDVTDTYFEGKGFSSKRRKGKDGKVRRLVQIGLAVTQCWGFPIMHKMYDGNVSDKCIFKDLALNLKERGIEAMIMDRGMVSISNLEALLKLKLKTIAGLSKSQSLIETYIAKIQKDEIYSLKHRVALKNTAVYIKSYKYMKGKLIVCYNPKVEYVKKEQTYQKGKESKNHRFFGFSMIYHNTNLKDAKVVKQYYQKDTIERAFKQLKGVLNLRPVRVWLKEHIESHVKICYLTYAMLSLLGYKIRKIMSPIEALENLKYGYKATIKDKKNNHEWEMTVPLKPKQKEILKAVGCSV